MPKYSDKQLQAIWDDFAKSVFDATPIDLTETIEEKKKRIEWLEKDGNEEEWFKYYFKRFYGAEPAPFHKAGTKRIMANPEWYEVRNWSRELAKSTRSMMEDLKLLLTKKKKYKLLISNSYDNAEKLLMPYIVNLEKNQRIINDYGKQRKLGSWSSGDITTRTGFSIRALGAGQSPRGTRKEETRPDIIEFDDFDTDEECLNPEIIDKKWKWVTEAAIPTRSISVATLIRWNGNIIAEDCCIVRAQEFANKVDTVNIRDRHGKSTWPSKNTEEFIDRVLSIIPYSAQQKEYFNNPVTDGKTFKEMKWGKCPSLKKLAFVVSYADPATSNKDRSSSRRNSQASFKSVILIGRDGLNYYIYKCFLDQVSNAKFIDALYTMHDYVGDATQLYTYIENNTLQDPFYEQVLLPLIYSKGKEVGRVLPVTPDGRKKPEKWHRIEANLEPINRNGQLILNEEEKDCPHMKRLAAQFKSASANSKFLDGPDGVEGGKHIIDTKVLTTGGNGFKAYRRKTNSKGF